MRFAGMSEVDALFACALAPLRTRRDIAMLGLSHRTVLGFGPPQFRQLVQLAEPDPGRRFTRLHASRHRLQLVELEPSAPDYLRRSLLGLCRVYNLLPSWIVEKCSAVKSFQGALQALVKDRAAAGCSG